MKKLMHDTTITGKEDSGGHPRLPLQERKDSVGERRREFPQSLNEKKKVSSQEGGGEEAEKVSSMRLKIPLKGGGKSPRPFENIKRIEPATRTS